MTQKSALRKDMEDLHRKFIKKNIEVGKLKEKLRDTEERLDLLEFAYFGRYPLDKHNRIAIFDYIKEERVKALAEQQKLQEEQKQESEIQETEEKISAEQQDAE